MGWTSISKTGEILTEEKDGRPVDLGNSGGLKAIIQEDYGHKVAVDLINGVIAIDFDSWNVQNDTLALDNIKTVLYICHDTHIGADLYGVKHGKPDKDGWYSDTIIPLVWRPIWFSRVTNGVPTKIIGAQTTLPKVYGRRNVKKMVMLFPDSRLGIY